MNFRRITASKSDYDVLQKWFIFSVPLQITISMHQDMKACGGRGGKTPLAVDHGVNVYVTCQLISNRVKTVMLPVKYRPMFVYSITL
jgi:hypothetical protein